MKKLQVETRKFLLRRILEEARYGTVSFNEIQNALAEVLIERTTSKDTDGTEANGDPQEKVEPQDNADPQDNNKTPPTVEVVSRRLLIENLNELKKQWQAGENLNVKPAKDEVDVVIENETRAEKAEKTEADLKRRLGAALWNYMFKIPLPDDVEFTRPDPTIEQELLRKIAALQKKSTAAIFADAGSTTGYAIEVLATAKQFPIPIREEGSKGDKDGQYNYRVIAPTITTNSVNIVKTVLNSRNRMALQVRLIGGDLRLDRESICGPMTELCFQQWNLRGDLALIGATSYFTNGISPIATDTEPGMPGFSSDHPSESWVKRTLLERCWIRVVILDSEKITYEGETSSLFAPLCKSTIDLVVTDDGRWNPEHNKEAMDAFLETAKQSEIAVIILQTKPRRKAKETNAEETPANGSNNGKAHQADTALEPVDKTESKQKGPDEIRPKTKSVTPRKNRRKAA